MINMTKKASQTQPVPASYMGVWQRHLLETNTFKDESSLVFWMQSQHYHIDIRLPASRNKVRNVSALAEYTDEELLILAEQQGFAGLTQIELANENSSEVCQWLREIDFQPPNGSRDIGKMLFTDANTVIETGLIESDLDESYLEVWRRLEQSQSPVSFTFTTGKNQHGLELPAYQMRAGNFVTYARPRSIALPKAASLIACIKTDQPARQQLLDWLDMEISFGEVIDEKHWKIKHSTLPFKENLISVY